MSTQFSWQYYRSELPHPSSVKYSIQFTAWRFPGNPLSKYWLGMVLGVFFLGFFFWEMSSLSGCYQLARLNAKEDKICPQQTCNCHTVRICWFKPFIFFTFCCISVQPESQMLLCQSPSCCPGTLQSFFFFCLIVIFNETMGTLSNTYPEK